MITSKQNEKFKKWMKLKTKKYRDQFGQFLVYGQHLIQIAQTYGAIDEIMTTNPNIQGTRIDVSLMQELMQTETMFDIMAVCHKTNIKKTSNRILMLDDVQDPDNVGALIRSASAFGFLHVILSHKCADLYNEKVIRASKGAIFDVYVERKPLIDAIHILKEQQYQIYIADANGNEKQVYHDKIALILGNEGHGVSNDIKDVADGIVSIPTNNVESLNVGVAGGILMYLWRHL
jgi:RNA methyltransferase, TrmH family